MDIENTIQFTFIAGGIIWFIQILNEVNEKKKRDIEKEIEKVWEKERSKNKFSSVNCQIRDKSFLYIILAGHFQPH